MIAVDTNILVYAFNPLANEHDGAVRAMSRLALAPAWGMPLIVAAEFYAVVTNPRTWAPPATTDEALGALDAWLATPGGRLLGESLETWASLRPMIEAARPRGRQVHDARIAAICIAHGVTEFWTLDRDYSRYPRLRVRNPLFD